MQDLARAVNGYRETFERWHPQYVSNTVRQMIARLQAGCRDAILGWQPPGAGAARSCVLVTDDRHAVLEQLRAQGWFAMPAAVTDGLRVRFGRLSCGYRIDFVGAAELNAAAGVDAIGYCVSAAIEPREFLSVEVRSTRAWLVGPAPPKVNAPAGRWMRSPCEPNRLA